MLSTPQFLLMRRARDRAIDIAIAPLGTVILLPDPDFRRRVGRCVSHVGSCLSLNRFAEWIERRSWPVQLWLWALACMGHRPTKYPKSGPLGKVIVSVDVAVGSIATGAGRQRIPSMPAESTDLCRL